MAIKSLNKDKIIKTYPLQHDMTHTKQMEILDFIHKYRYISKIMRNNVYTIFQKTGYINKTLPYKDLLKYQKIKEIMPKGRYQRMALDQINEMILSRESNIQNTISDFIERQNNLSNIQKHMLHILNRMSRSKLHECRNPFGKSDLPNKSIIRKILNQEQKESIVIPDSIYTLYKQIYRNITKHWRIPKTSNISPRINSLCAKVSNPINANNKNKFLYWIEFSKLVERGKMYLPLVKNEYFISKRGENMKSVYLCEKQGKIDFKISKDMTETYQKRNDEYNELIQNYEGKKKVIAIDYGLTTLFTDQMGNQYGQVFYTKLKELDNLIQRRIKYLNGKGITRLRTDKFYTELILKCRNFIKNEINRCLNHIVKQHNPTHLVLEKLDFRGMNLSRRMNRILSNCGRGVISSKLLDLKDKGVIIKEVNPAYTSQICSGCGYCDKKNRNGKEFKCLSCGKKIDADCNGARNIGYRYLMNCLNGLLNNDIIEVEPCFMEILLSDFSKLRYRKIGEIIKTEEYRKVFRGFKDFFTSGENYIYNFEGNRNIS